MIHVHALILNAHLLFTWGTREVSTLSQEQSRMLTVSTTIQHGSEAMHTLKQMKTEAGE